MPPSGEQFEIEAGSQRATITEVGATLRTYAVDGSTPWTDSRRRSPRTRGGVRPRRGPIASKTAGTRSRASKDEPRWTSPTRERDPRLVRWPPWRVTSRSPSAVALGCVLHPQPAYPWRLELSVEYSIDDTGLTVSAAALSVLPRRRRRHRLPSYLTLGSPSTMHVTIPARTRLEADERGSPLGEVDVDGDFDFREAKPIGRIELDTGYTDRSGPRTGAPGSRTSPEAAGVSRSGRTRRSGT